MLFLLSIVISTNKTEAAVQDINEGIAILTVQLVLLVIIMDIEL